MIGVGFQKEIQESQNQATGLAEDFANVNADWKVVSSLGGRTSGQVFAHQLNVHNSVYNPLLAEGLRIGNIIQNRNARHSMFKVIVNGYVFALITQRGHTRGR